MEELGCSSKLLAVKQMLCVLALIGTSHRTPTIVASRCMLLSSTLGTAQAALVLHQVILPEVFPNVACKA